MLKGFYAAASAMVTGLNRQQVLAHNIANIDTPGFKQVLLAMQDFKQSAVIPPKQGQPMLAPILPYLNNQIGLDRLNYVGNLGLGVMNSPEQIDFTQGALRFTGEPLDVAVMGEGFFNVRTPDGTTQHTRDGRFILNNGQLLTVDGNQVLDTTGNPITLQTGDTAVGMDGQVSVNGTAGPQIGLSVFSEEQKKLMHRTQYNTLAFDTATTPAGGTPGRIRQGYLEGGNANITQITTQMMSTARAYEAAQNLVKMQDDILARTIGTLGRS